MKTFISLAAAAFAVAATPASAGVLDFAGLGQDEALLPGDTISFADPAVDVVVVGTGFIGNETGSLASGLGLGVCNDATGSQVCDDDPAIEANEFLDLVFLTAEAVTISDITFLASDGMDISESITTNVDVLTDNGAFFGTLGGLSALIAAGDALFADTFTFSISALDEAFFIGAINLNDDTGVIPVPAALPLLLSGLAGLGFAGRRRKQAA